MPRDNFSQTVINKLKARVANRCSNPDCRVPTSAPAENGGVNSIGIAAHICAAAPGGPRYDKSMSPRQRGSIENAIWLCANCSTDIDKDSSRYSVEVLHEWKLTAENSARLELGKKLPGPSDAIDTLTSALTGFPKNYLANAISNVHQATAKSLESLDPRFTVKTSHEAGKTSFMILAKENVPLKMKVLAPHANEHISNLIEHGEDVEFGAEAISFEGSKLLEKLLDDGPSILTISSNKIPATQKLWLVADDSSVIEPFDDINGSISLGDKSFSFQGAACNKIFRFSYRKTLKQSDDASTVSLSLDLAQWEGLDLRSLPYFSKLFSLFSKMADGWKLFSSLEIDGNVVTSSRGIKVDDLDFVLGTANFLSYVNRCRIVASKLQHDIKYTSKISFTSEEHRVLAEIVEALEERLDYGENDLTGNASCNLIVSPECKNVKALAAMTAPSLIRMVMDPGGEIVLFGTPIALPSKSYNLISVIPKIHGRIDRLKEGDTVKVEWLPQNNFKCLIRYELPQVE